MKVTMAILMCLTGLVTLLSILVQCLNGVKGRSIFRKPLELASYLCLSTAGMGLVISGLGALFGSSIWITIPLFAWAIGLTKLLFIYRQSRYAPRSCMDCGLSMVRMGEGERFLSKRQEIEERLESRVYDLWVCSNGHRQLFQFEGRFGSLFKKCPSCLVHAVYRERQIVMPEGVFEDTRCAACDARYQRNPS